jgi:hypothetical protein
VFFFVKSTSDKSFQAESFTASSNQSLKTTTPRRLIDFFGFEYFSISYDIKSKLNWNPHYLTPEKLLQWAGDEAAEVKEAKEAKCR